MDLRFHVPGDQLAVGEVMETNTMNKEKSVKQRYYVVDGEVTATEVKELYETLAEKNDFAGSLLALLRRFGQELSDITALKVRARSGRVLVSANVEYGSICLLKGGDIILNEEYATRVFQDSDGDSGFWVVFKNVQDHILEAPDIRVEGDVWELMPRQRKAGTYVLWVKYPVSQVLPLLKLQKRFAKEEFADFSQLEDFVESNWTETEWTDEKLQAQARKRLMPNNAGLRHSQWDMYGELQFNKNGFFNPLRAWDTEVNGMKGASKDDRSAGMFMLNTSGQAWRPEYKWLYKANSVMEFKLSELLWLTNETFEEDLVKSLTDGFDEKFIKLDESDEELDATSFHKWKWQKKDEALAMWDFLIENNLLQFEDIKDVTRTRDKFSMTWQTVVLNNIDGEPVGFVENKRGESYGANENVLGYRYILPPVFSMGVGSAQGRVFCMTAEEWLRGEFVRNWPAEGFGQAELSLHEFESGSARIPAIQAYLAEQIGRIGELVPTVNDKIQACSWNVATVTVAVDFKKLKFEERVSAIADLGNKVGLAWASGKGSDQFVRKYCLAKPGTIVPMYAKEDAHPRRTADLRSQLVQAYRLQPLKVVVVLGNTKAQPLTSTAAVEAGRFLNDYRGQEIKLAMPKVLLDAPSAEEAHLYQEVEYPTWNGRTAICWVAKMTRGIQRVPKVMHSGYALKNVLREYATDIQTIYGESVDMLWPVQDIADKDACGILKDAKPVTVAITHFNGEVEYIDGLELSAEMSTKWHRSGAFSENVMSSKKIRNIAGSAQWAIRETLLQHGLCEEYSIDQVTLDFWKGELQWFRDLTRVKNQEANEIGEKNVHIERLKQVIADAKKVTFNTCEGGYKLTRLDRSDLFEDVI